MIAVQLQEDDATVEAELPGRASAEQQVEFSFRVTGHLTEYPMRVGQRVRRGELLARLDPRDFRTTVDDYTGQLARAEADAEVARLQYERAQRIRVENSGAISQAIVDERLGAFKQAEAQVLSISAKLDDARNDLIDTELFAPFDGVIVATYVNNYEEVDAKQPVLRLVDPSSIEVTVQVPEQHISKIDLIRSIVCRFDAYPGIDVTAQIHEVGREASSDTRTFPVTLIMAQPEDIVILPGMAARVTFTVDAQAIDEIGGSVIPASAVFSDEQDRAFVWLLDREAGTVSRKQVSPRMPVGDGLSVDGLYPGDWVVTAGVHFLRDNQRVRLMDGEGG
ncbi:efflux RND transporter periplasmic adaptor subunit [Mucisphaera calidilacus]|uniref:efflux RND transporter periplasmic adaptor subunit n=1 Tax=Mucisphaera calidilacus TaxID=2527982 RepID=UPI001F3D1B16|nr:efflux RND transporter periplasmic adaptor subunit [Mucisphaera calidilacus]